ncbi:MAG: N-acetylneuraminate synthase [Novosphingobium sp.]|nr:N-acetylneuraminate synthase [Novosphingobium sp.]
MTRSPFIIAEAGVNHNGDADRALAMVDIAAVAGADAIKFQTFSADRLVTRNAAKAAYQLANTGSGSQYEMLKALELSDETHRALFDRCTQRGIEFMSTAFDEQAADVLASLGMVHFKIPSGDLTNLPFLQHIAAKGRAVILSTGMGKMEEIHDAVAALRAGHPAGDNADITVLHCTSNYPARPEELNLRAMASIARETGLPVGYSDHSEGSEAAMLATAMGATVIEKHFTLDRNLPGPDHRASLESDELNEFVACLRNVETMLGSAEKGPTQSEMETRKAARRSITATRVISAGENIAADAIALKRPGTGLEPKEFDTVVGRIASRDIAEGEQFDWDALQR